ncbi:Rieske (2Fe-2S) iron-sulfur domain protein [Isosphaera pallida ATCC 43644]|jgi:3-phenylpropionate/trans-cinnamate dioxygenase ferredoxin subunit|uniref:Rieske (2Fe-2S) iron-sulfur domain protein n=1 Tax=Isosphaera pallida (strain ATCC 43644 / DSM 9630 / IS1B) TaxID=575540 RepID=E8R4J8_ISOPI|nr:non-heme iron oxygenase ferredoxin subunit [Isosphaera pallida]ADV63793.1 Rieske (2Fe-2S) iron-sulfur domain protein [Isosphaera pallida ATCC 43644]
MSSSTFIDVADLNDLPPGGHLLVEHDGQSLALFNIDGTVYAIEDLCTHDGGPLVEGEIHGYEVTCSRHGARFDVRTGKALCMPAVEDIRTFPVEIRDGRILVCLDED